MNTIIQANLEYFVSGVLLIMVGLIAGNTIAFLKIRKINKIGKKFFSGKNGVDLEEIINKQMERIDKNKKDIKELFDAYEKIYRIAFKGVHKIGIVRYNPFGDIGGNQSFVIALLDGNNSGIIISSLHSREGVRLFAKSIFKGLCPDYPLTEEEKTAIKSARSSKKFVKV